MLIKYSLTLLTLSFSYFAQAHSFDLKKELKTDVTQFELDQKKSKGEICKNIDTPEWDKNAETGEGILRFGPHIFLSQVNSGVVADKTVDPDCTYELNTTFKNQQAKKTIKQECALTQDSAYTQQIFDFKQNEIRISYIQTQNKKEKKSTCYLKLTKGKK